MFKRKITLIVAVLLVFAILGGCGHAESKPTDTEPKPTQSAEEANVLKILTLGSSSSVDACHMLNLVTAAEGVEQELIIGTLYYSGCSLTQHVKFLTEDSNVYQLYLSSTSTPNAPPTIMNDISMRNALEYDCWDIILLQGSSFETMEDEAFTNGNTETIKKYVNEHKLNPEMIFAYHTIGISSTDKDLIATYKRTPNPYDTTAAKWGYDRERMYNERIDRVRRFVTTDTDYQFIINSITAVENAITSYLGEKGIKRDYTHLTDIGRLIAAYCYYCALYDIEELDEIKVTSIPRAFLKSTENRSIDLVLTDAQKAIILEAVNNTLKNPYQITQSQYTQAPAQ